MLKCMNKWDNMTYMNGGLNDLPDNMTFSKHFSSSVSLNRYITLY